MEWFGREVRGWGNAGGVYQARGPGRGGARIQNPRLHGLLTFPNFKGNDWYVFVYMASEFDGELLESSPEGRLEWIDDDQLTSLNLWESDHIFLPWIAAGKFFSAKFEYEGDHIQDYQMTFHP